MNQKNLVRIQKVMSQVGIASRRQAERMMEEGRVSLNGKTVTELGTKMDPDADHLKVDGKPVKLRVDKVYIALNKPRGYLTTSFDEKGRATIYDLMKEKFSMWLFTVGRLDCNSEGLLLLTNDGSMSRFLTLPQNGIERVYEAKLQGIITDEQIERLNGGIKLDDGWVSLPKVRFLKKATENSWIEIRLRSGKNREVRRIIERVGYNVLKLRRISFGPIRLGDLKPGDMRNLTKFEVNKLKTLCTSQKS